LLGSVLPITKGIIMEKNEQWVRIQAYKHDGLFHRMWSHCYLLCEDDSYFILASIRARVIENNGRVWHTKEPAIFIFSKKEWFNVIAMIKETGITYYANVASPTIRDKGFLKYIDYDLDLKLYPNGGTRILDQNEYERHSKSLDYGDEIKAILNDSVTSIQSKMNNREFPFSDEKINEYYEKFLGDTKCRFKE
jgi:hypothetical protein